MDSARMNLGRAVQELRALRRITQKDAWSLVAGNSCYNDGSVREWQRHTIQWTAGKIFAQTGMVPTVLVMIEPAVVAHHVADRTRPEGDRLRAAMRQVRQERGLTQRAVAERLNTYQERIQRWESGDRRIDVVDLADYSRAVGVDMVEILRRAGLTSG
jgi:ribosome-binding protein aMBF1 (putative translation factor)